MQSKMLRPDLITLTAFHCTVIKSVVDLLYSKAMHWTKNFAIPSFAKIDLIGIPTGESLAKINWTSKTRNFPENVTKIFPKMLTKNATKNFR